MVRYFAQSALFCLVALSTGAGAQPDSGASVESNTAGFEQGDAAALEAPIAASELDLGVQSASVHDLVRGITDNDETRPAALRLDDKPATKPDTLFYQVEEVEARAEAIKSRIASLLGNTPDEQSEEERERALQQKIALDKSYSSGATGLSGQRSGAPRSDLDNPTLRLRLIEFALIVWDVLTHPVTITLAVLGFIGRVVLAMLRLKRERKSSRRRRSHSRRARGNAAPEAVTARSIEQPMTEYEQQLERRRQRRYSRSRRHHRRSSLLDLFRST